MIKKVVIPKTEDKWVCELSDKEFKDVNFCISKNKQYFIKQETPKPLADDEVSIDDVDIKSYIYGGIMRDCTVPEVFLIQNYDYKPKTSQVVKICENTCSANSVYSNENDYFSIYMKQYGLYQFEDQQEFFEWALKQLGGN